jgi:hypothetical protein
MTMTVPAFKLSNDEIRRSFVLWHVSLHVPLVRRVLQIYRYAVMGYYNKYRAQPSTSFQGEPVPFHRLISFRHFGCSSLFNARLSSPFPVPAHPLLLHLMKKYGIDPATIIEDTSGLFN